MNFLEDIQRILDTNTSLFFIKKFVVDFPDAQLYLVGGSVRDLLMKRKTLDTDFDLVVRIVESRSLEQWLTNHGKVDLVGRTFGVYKFFGAEAESHSCPIDIALPRTEHALAQTRGGYKDFDIQSSATLLIEDDLSRRDFTINAMAIDLKTGDLIDPFGGINEIETKTIRAVGDPTKRFEEDLSRMLRAVRFATELHFQIETNTLESIKRLASRLHETREDKKEEYVVARTTIGSELAKGFASNPFGMIDWLTRTQILEVLFEQTKNHAKTVEVISHIKQEQPTLVVALLLRYLSHEQIKNTLSKTGLDSLPHGSRLRIEPDDVIWLIDRVQQNFTEESIVHLRASLFEKYFMNGRTQILLNALHATGNSASADAAEDRVQEIRERWFVESDESIPPLLSGNDLLAIGIPAGPQVRQWLEELRDEQLEGKILDREQAKRWLKTKTSK